MIREAKENDLKKINYFLQKFSSDYKIKKILSYKRYFLIDDIAFMGISVLYDRVELDYIYVEKEKRNKNYASWMVKYLINYCDKSKYKNISLEVNVNNLAAVKLYEKYGFRVTKRIKKYYQGEDAYLMVRGEL